MHNGLSTNADRLLTIVQATYVNMGGCESFEQGKVHIFLLFSSKEVYQGLWCVKTMSATSNANNACDIAEFGGL